jgi:hypothetical protein
VRNSFAVSTDTVGPPAPPMVPFWPHAATAAKPSGVPTAPTARSGFAPAIAGTNAVTVPATKALAAQAISTPRRRPFIVGRLMM